MIEAQEQLSQLILDDVAFREKVQAAELGLSEDYLAIALHAVAETLVYERTEMTMSAIDALYGPLESSYTWESLGRTEPPPWAGGVA